MFKIELTLASFTLYGLEALDERRRLGLHDASHIHVRDLAAKTDVSEGFARKHFGPRDTTGYRRTTHDKLMRGEIGIDMGEDCYVLNLGSDRLIELWLEAGKQ